MVVWLVGMMFALVVLRHGDGFVGWVFLLPFALVGVILCVFGKWADQVGKCRPPRHVAVERSKKG